jgi:fatty acid desaturase
MSKKRQRVYLRPGLLLPMKSDHERRAEARDAASEGRFQQRRHQRSLNRLLLIILMIMVGIALTGYALAIWWR